MALGLWRLHCRRRGDGAGELYRAGHAGGDEAAGGQRHGAALSLSGACLSRHRRRADRCRRHRHRPAALVAAAGPRADRPGAFLPHRCPQAALAPVSGTFVLMALAAWLRHDDGCGLLGSDLHVHHLRAAAAHHAARHPNPDHRLYHRCRIHRLVDPVDPHRQCAAGARKTDHRRRRADDRLRSCRFRLCHPRRFDPADPALRSAAGWWLRRLLAVPDACHRRFGP